MRSQRQALDDWNFYGDPRTSAKVEGVPTVSLDGEDNTGLFYFTDEVELPWRWEVCWLCEGKGSHVNPAIDAGGLTAEDFAEDPDFADSYFEGRYDQPCNACGGRTTVKALDRESCNAAYLEAWDRQERERAQDLAEEIAERRMGA